MRSDRRNPVLRREAVLPPGSTDLYGHYKTLRENDGQLIRWKRLPGKGRLAGVCAGLAYRFGTRPWKVRAAFVLGFFFLAGLTAAYYLLAATFVRARRRLPRDFRDRTGTSRRSSAGAKGD
jgi:phage shock protein PspC (stress-responsive transcriptional regulator)